MVYLYEFILLVVLLTRNTEYSHILKPHLHQYVLKAAPGWPKSEGGGVR